MDGGGYISLFELASGGMGRVSLAIRRASSFERLYAVKRLKAKVVDDPECRRMFLDEARLAGLIRHPNVVSVLDAGEDEEGPFLVMDWVDGISLMRLIQMAREEGPLGIALGCRIIAAAARGLDASHVLYTHDGERIELVHRDVSPQNILLAYDGTVRVTDFGIAKALGRGPGTESILVKGKVGYMSPEQLRFERLDRRSDLYSLGVVLFELLAGRRLYNSSARDMEAIVNEVVHEPPMSIAEVRRDAPPELDELLFSLLAKKPDERPDTAREVAERLEAIASEALDADEPLDSFLEEHFSSQRDAMRQRIAAALAEVRQPPSVTYRVKRGRNRRAPGWLPAVVIAAAAIGLAIALALNADWLGVGAGQSATGSTEPPSVAAPPTAAEDTMSETTPTTTAPAAAASSGDSGSDDREGEASASQDRRLSAAERARRARLREARRRRQERVEASGQAPAAVPQPGQGGWGAPPGQ